MPLVIDGKEWSPAKKNDRVLKAPIPLGVIENYYKLMGEPMPELKTDDRGRLLNGAVISAPFVAFILGIMHRLTENGYVVIGVPPEEKLRELINTFYSKDNKSK